MTPGRARRWLSVALLAVAVAAAGCGDGEETAADDPVQTTTPGTPGTTGTPGTAATVPPSPPTTKVNFGTGTTLFLQFIPGGKPGTGTITVTNDTGKPIANVVVTVPKADVASVAAAGGACEQLASDFRCRLGSLAPGQKIDLTVSLAASASTTALAKDQSERLSSIRVATDVAGSGTKEVTVRAPIRVLPRN